MTDTAKAENGLTENLAAERAALGDIPAYGDTTLAVVYYELGQVSKNLLYATEPNVTDDEKRALVSNACIEIADVLMQVAILYEKIKGGTTSFASVSLLELLEFGQERQLERMRELKAKGRAKLVKREVSR